MLFSVELIVKILRSIVEIHVSWHRSACLNCSLYFCVCLSGCLSVCVTPVNRLWTSFTLPVFFFNSCTWRVVVKHPEQLIIHEARGGRVNLCSRIFYRAAKKEDGVSWIVTGGRLAFCASPCRRLQGVQCKEKDLKLVHLFCWNTLRNMTRKSAASSQIEFSVPKATITPEQSGQAISTDHIFTGGIREFLVVKQKLKVRYRTFFFLTLLCLLFHKCRSCAVLRPYCNVSVPPEQTLVTLKMEAACSSETLQTHYTTRCKSQTTF